MSKINIINLTCYSLLNAISTQWPEVKFGEIKFTDHGFNCDVDIGGENISEKDFSHLEVLTNDLLSARQIVVEEISSEDSKRWLSDNKQIYLQELFENFEDRLLLYKQDDFEIIINHHIELQELIDTNPKSFFKILKIGGAYWLNKADQVQLQRLQVVVFDSQQSLDDYLEQQDKKVASDHRQIGQVQDLFLFSDLVGSGLPLWLENGATIRRQLENFIINEEIKRDYSHVCTPDIASLKLYETSGHYPYYKDSMYSPIDIDGKKFMLRPMTCPHHFQIYKHSPHSYRELPIRYAELAKLYRYEQQGELSGLTRVRTFTLADAHIICRPDQVNEEIDGALQLIEDVADVFGLIKDKDYFYRLSLGNVADKDKYYDNDALWQQAEACLRNVLKSRGGKFTEVKDEAAFYGPKIDIQMFNNNGKEETAFTVQYDFVMPKRFQLTYIDSNQQSQEVVVIHRSSIGAIERLVAFLIEFYKGKFPIWLAPCQIKILTVNDQETLLDYANFLKAQVLDNNLRAKIDSSANSIGKKIRQSQLEAVPYTVVLGDKELEKEEFQVNIRSDLVSAALSSDITYSWREIIEGLLIDNDSKN